MGSLQFGTFVNFEVNDDMFKLFKLNSNLKKNFVIMTLGFVVLLTSIYILRHESISVAQMISEDIGKDLVSSNFASAERRIQLLRSMGQTGLSLKANDYVDVQINQCLFEINTPVNVDGLEIAQISNCLNIQNLIPAIFHSPGVISILLMTVIFLLLARTIHLRLEKTAFEIQKNNELFELNKQVAHDIRSPLSALSILLKNTVGLSDDHRTLLHHSIRRINDIANTLLNKKMSPLDVENTNNFSTSYYLYSVIDSIISEKRLQYRNSPNLFIDSQIESDEHLFSNFDPVNLSRILSNLINNSVEALDNGGTVCISLLHTPQYAVIKISDNGKGIPEKVISQIGTKGFSHGKSRFTSSGSGLGIHHAKKTIEDFNGTFSITSQEGKGTEIIIQIPKSKTPSWFLDQISIPENARIAILDDDPSIHSAWNSRLASEKNGRQLKLFNFYTIKEFEVWFTNNTADLYFIDYNISDLNENGLDLIHKNNISDNSVLVTSQFADIELQKRAEKLNVSILPKSLLNTIPIVSVDSTAQKMTILLDDDALVRACWQMRSKELNLDLKIYANPEDLFSDLIQFNKNSTFYIDNHLGHHISGVDIAKKLYNKGFKEIYMATGYEKEEFNDLSFIKGVVGKDPIW